jgi:hypothetical protein
MISYMGQKLSDNGLVGPCRIDTFSVHLKTKKEPVLYIKFLQTMDMYNVQRQYCHDDNVACWQSESWKQT